MEPKANIDDAQFEAHAIPPAGHGVRSAAGNGSQASQTESGLGESVGRTRWIAYLVAAVVGVLLIVIPYNRSKSGDTPKPAGGAEDFPTLLNRSEAEYRSGQYRAAVASAEAALRLNPNSAQAHNNLAVSHLALQEFPQALESAQTAVRLAPDMELARNNLAWVVSSKKAFDDSIANPKSADDWINRSLARYKERRYDECVEASRKAITMTPNSAVAYNNLAACALAQGKTDDAVLAATKALSLQPNFDLAKNNLEAAIRARKAAKPDSSK